MTTFLVSHNLQIQNTNCPPWQGEQLAAGLNRLCSSVSSAEVLAHPHWRIRLISSSTPSIFAQELVKAWLLLRSENAHSVNHAILALGGRKDSPAAIGSPLNAGDWGVDLVETLDVDSFLKTIQWQALKSTRPADGIFEVVCQGTNVSELT